MWEKTPLLLQNGKERVRELVFKVLTFANSAITIPTLANLIRHKSYSEFTPVARLSPPGAGPLNEVSHEHRPKSLWTNSHKRGVFYA
jgi:hypothetical protein